jgi:hypothetical protein
MCRGRNADALQQSDDSEGRQDACALGCDAATATKKVHHIAWWARIPAVFMLSAYYHCL